MFVRSLLTVAASVAAVNACTNATPLSTNPVTSPNAASNPIIGQAFNIEWKTNYPQKGSTVTMSLYNGCPENCKELTDVAAGVQNTGSITWTPSTSLKPGDDYGILFINENPCMTVWTYFTIYPEGTVANSTLPDAISSVPSSTPSAAATSPASSTPSSKPSSTPSTVAPITVTATDYLVIYATTLSTVYVTAPNSQGVNAEGACASGTSVTSSDSSATTAAGSI